MPTRPTTDPSGGWSQLPLPGTHACVTWQLNVTLHPTQRGAKYVSILRDPDAQVELARVGTALVGDLMCLEELSAHLAAVLGQLRYLGGIPTPD